jgi:small subunit ribosomal protein S20
LDIERGFNHVASHNSALKAHRQSLARRDQNRQMRTRLRRALRDIRAGIDSGSGNGDLQGAVRTTVSLVDKMAGKGLIHRNTAARYKSRLASRLAKRSPAA